MRDPDPKWILSAAKKAGLDAELEEARHPSRPHRSAGRVLVRKATTKQAILHAVAERLHE